MRSLQAYGLNVKTPRVSIVIPSYNAAQFIEQTITSVLAQSLASWELIVVDDGSDDATPRIVATMAQQDARIRLLQQANSGVAAARNRGQREAHAEAEFILFLDHDDLLQPTALARLVGTLEAQPDVVAAYGDFAVIDSGGGTLAKQSLGVDLARKRFTGWHYVACTADEATTLSILIASDCILTPGQVLIRRQFIREQGLFRSEFDAYDDWMAWIELAQQSQLAFIPDVVLHYRKHERNQSQNIGKLRRGKRAILREIIRSPDFVLADRQVACIAWLHMDYADARDKLSYGVQSLRSVQVGAALQQFVRAALCVGSMIEPFVFYVTMF